MSRDGAKHGGSPMVREPMVPEIGGVEQIMMGLVKDWQAFPGKLQPMQMALEIGICLPTSRQYLIPLFERNGNGQQAWGKLVKSRFGIG